MSDSRPEGVTSLGADQSVPARRTAAGPPPSAVGPAFLTVAEVAALMRVSKMSVYRIIHAGELEAVRFGRSFRVPQSAVDTYLRSAFYETG